MSVMPETYWVVGTATNVGKTTTSTALISTLAKRGKKALGFKPIAGGRFRSLIDFALKEYPSNPGIVFGNDAFSLCEASELTTIKDIDLISPWQLVFNVNSDDTLLIRTGSKEAGNIKYYMSPDFHNMLQRKDISRLVSQLKLPIDKFTVIDPATSIPRDQIDQDCKSIAYNALLKRHPDTVVIEGAGPILPTWDNMPPVNHIVLLDPTHIHLIPNVNLQFPNTHRFVARHLIELIQKSNFKTFSTHQFYCESAIKAEVISSELDSLLSKAGI